MVRLCGPKERRWSCPHMIIEFIVMVWRDYFFHNFTVSIAPPKQFPSIPGVHTKYWRLWHFLLTDVSSHCSQHFTLGEALAPVTSISPPATSICTPIHANPSFRSVVLALKKYRLVERQEVEDLETWTKAEGKNR